MKSTKVVIRTVGSCGKHWDFSVSTNVLFRYYGFGRAWSVHDK